jgi:hypothetical protein
MIMVLTLMMQGTERVVAPLSLATTPISAYLGPLTSAELMTLATAFNCKFNLALPRGPVLESRHIYRPCVVVGPALRVGRESRALSAIPRPRAAAVNGGESCGAIIMSSPSAVLVGSGDRCIGMVSTER